MQTFTTYKPLALFLSMLCISVNIHATDFTYKGINYTTITNSTCQTKKGINYYYPGNTVTGDITIPDTVYDSDDNAYSVTEIGDYSFQKCAGLTSISLPTTLKVIGRAAFEGCSALTSLQLPERTQTIYAYAFSGCDSIKHIVIPELVESIHEYAFGTNLDYVVDNSCATLYYTSNNTSAITTNYSQIFGSSTKVYHVAGNSNTGGTELLSLAHPKLSKIILGCMIITIPKIAKEVYNLKVYDSTGTLCPRHDDNTYHIPTITSDREGKQYFSHSVYITYMLYNEEPVKCVASLYSTNDGDGINIKVSGKTQTTCTVKIAIETDENCTIKSITRNGIVKSNNSDDKFDNLYPDYSDTKRYTIETDRGTFTYDVKVSTLSWILAVKATADGPCRAHFAASWNNGDAKPKYYLTYTYRGNTYSENSLTLDLEGLEPNSEIVATLHATVNGQTYTTSATTSTTALEWGDNTATPTSLTSCRIMSATNCNAGSGTGFEWKRYDAPDALAATKVSCPVVDGILVGSLRNLNSEVYYKYRPYYTSNSGKTYYGDWTPFFTGDANVYFDPDVRTLEDIRLMSNSATLTGYVLPGSDEVTTQGFQYRKVSGSANISLKSLTDDGWISVAASGIKPSVTIEGLDYGTQYEYRAFATTDSKTFYGESRYFETEAQDGVDEVFIDSTSAELTLNTKSNPDLQIAVTGASATTVAYEIYNICGLHIAHGEVAADGAYYPVAANLTNGLYVVIVSDGRCTATRKFAVR
jgi:hypothetical protein